MKKFASSMMLTLGCVSAMSTAFATQSAPDSLSNNVSDHATNVATSSLDVDKIIGELSRQREGAPSLVRDSREPAALSTHSALISAQAKAETQMQSDTLDRLTTVASSSVSRFRQAGRASWYGTQFHGRRTASGERFDMHALTAAHRSLPFNSYIKVTNTDNGQSVVVKVNDRGPFHGNRILDLSYGAAKQIGLVQSGVGNVSIERITQP